MRLHASADVTAQTIQAATTAAGMRGVHATATRHGSRTHAQAWEVSLTGTSSRRPNSGRGGADGDDYAATWDEWGMFLAALYAVDPTMRAGSGKHPAYVNAEDFHAITRGRFLSLTAPYQHGGGGHRWERVSDVATCKTCEAECEPIRQTIARRAGVTA